MKSISNFISHKLKLKVNEQKSAVGRPQERKFLGFSFTDEPEPKRRVAPKSVKRFKERVREITRRRRGVSVKQVVRELTTYLRGWNSYYGHCQTPVVMKDLNGWVRRRIRSLIWTQWKNWKTRYRELSKRRVDRGAIARILIHNRKGSWGSSLSLAMSQAFRNAQLRAMGLHELTVRGNV